MTHLRRDAAGQVVAVRVVGDVDTRAVEVLQPGHAHHAVVAHRRVADRRRPRQIAVTRLVGHLIAQRVGKVLPQRRALARKLHGRGPVQGIEGPRDDPAQGILHHRLVVSRVAGVGHQRTKNILACRQAIQGIVALRHRAGTIGRAEQVAVGVEAEGQQVGLSARGIIPRLAGLAVDQVAGEGNPLSLLVGRRTEPIDGERPYPGRRSDGVVLIIWYFFLNRSTMNKGT